MIRTSGVNHITVRVKDLKRSLQFYKEILSAETVHLGHTDAYLSIGNVWVCLLEKRNAKPICNQSIRVDHIAFTIEEKDFDEAVTFLQKSSIPVTRGPIERGGGKTISFLDPDENEWELFTGSLAKRMKIWK